MSGAEDARLLDNFDPAFELCAGSIHEPRLQVYTMHFMYINEPYTDWGGRRGF